MHRYRQNALVPRLQYRIHLRRWLRRVARRKQTHGKTVVKLHPSALRLTRKGTLPSLIFHQEFV